MYRHSALTAVWRNIAALQYRNLGKTLKWDSVNAPALFPFFYALYLSVPEEVARVSLFNRPSKDVRRSDAIAKLYLLLQSTHFNLS